MRGRVLKGQTGLTLTELLITLGILSVMLAAMFAATKAMVHAWATGQHRVGVQQNGRSGLEWVTRRIRAAGLDVDITTGPIFTVAESGRICFRADPATLYEYTTESGRLVERIHSGDCNSQPLTVRFLTAAEEVGIITVSDLNFCYFGFDNELLNPPQNSGTGRCGGSVAELGAIYRVQMRLTIVSGRPGEEPITLYSQAFVRPQEMP